MEEDIQEEQKIVQQIKLVKAPQYRKKNLQIMKLAQYMTFQPCSFPNKEEDFQQETELNYEDDSGQKRTKKVDPELVVRWRKEKGKIISNAKYVEFEDGSKFIFIGENAFEITTYQQSFGQVYYRMEDIYEFYDFVPQRLMMKPCQESKFKKWQVGGQRKSQYTKLDD